LPIAIIYVATYADSTRARAEKYVPLVWPWAGWRMPNALILEYQKSVIWHAPSRLHKGLHATGIDRDPFGQTTGSVLPLLQPGQHCKITAVNKGRPLAILIIAAYAIQTVARGHCHPKSRVNCPKNRPKSTRTAAADPAASAKSVGSSIANKNDSHYYIMRLYFDASATGLS
jgi:hypothetical protein